MYFTNFVQFGSMLLFLIGKKKKNKYTKMAKRVTSNGCFEKACCLIYLWTPQKRQEDSRETVNSTFTTFPICSIKVLFKMNILKLILNLR